jgi:hypothetical protein
MTTGRALVEETPGRGRTPREPVTLVATGLIAASLIARLVMYLAGYSNPTADVVLDVAIFGLLAATFAMGAVRAARTNRATQAWISFAGAVCWVAFTVRILLRFLG